MPSKKYRGQTTKLFYAGAYDTRPLDTGISGSSRVIAVADAAGKASARLKLVVTNIAVGTAGGVFSKHEYEPAPQVKAA